MITEHEKLRASIEALEQILGLTGKQNGADINWAYYLLSLVNKRCNSSIKSQVSKTYVKELPVTNGKTSIKHRHPERRSGTVSRRHTKPYFTMFYQSGGNCRRVNKDRRLQTRSRRYKMI